MVKLIFKYEEEVKKKKKKKMKRKYSIGRLKSISGHRDETLRNNQFGLFLLLFLFISSQRSSSIISSWLRSYLRRQSKK
jgi:hypothetical protein